MQLPKYLPRWWRTAALLWLATAVSACATLAPYLPSLEPDGTATAIALTPTEEVFLRAPTITPTFTPAPTTTPVPLPSLTPTRIPEPATYRNEEHRFSLTYPDNWLVNDDDSHAILMASDEARLVTNVLDVGGVIFLFPEAFTADPPPSPTAVLTAFIQNFVVFDSEEVTQPATAARVAGQEAAVATADAVFNRYPVKINYYTFVRDGQILVVVVMLAEETVAEYEPTAVRIINSLRME